MMQCLYGDGNSGEVHITRCQPEGGATHSQSQDCTDVFRACVTLCGGREAQPAALLTRSGVYMQTFRLTLTTCTVWAPRRGWSLSCFLEQVDGSRSMAGQPRIRSLRVGTPRD